MSLISRKQFNDGDLYAKCRNSYSVKAVLVAISLCKKQWFKHLYEEAKTILLDRPQITFPLKNDLNSSNHLCRTLSLALKSTNVNLIIRFKINFKFVGT